MVLKSFYEGKENAKCFLETDLPRPPFHRLPKGVSEPSPTQLCSGVKDSMRAPGGPQGWFRLLFTCAHAGVALIWERQRFPWALPHRAEQQRPRTFVPLQDIFIGLEVLLLFHVQVGGRGQVPRHAEVRGAGRARGPGTWEEASATQGWRGSATAGPGRGPQRGLRRAAGCDSEQAAS